MTLRAIRSPPAALLLSDAGGLNRWLRPEYQAPDRAAHDVARQQEIELETARAAAKTAVLPEKQSWPATLAARVGAVQKALPATGRDPEALRALFAMGSGDEY